MRQGWTGNKILSEVRSRGYFGIRRKVAKAPANVASMMRLTEEQAQKLGIKPECKCEENGLPLELRGLAPDDPDSHYLFCPLGQWLAARRALGGK